MPTPFDNAFNPDRGGLTGFIGGLAGVPTGQQREGGATGAALQELAQLKAAGADNQTAVIKFLQTPQGQDYFANAGPDGMKQLADGLTQMTQPAPQIHNVPEGGRLFSTNPQTGATSQVGDNPKSYPPTVVGPQDMLFDRSGNKIGENTNQKASETPADVKSFTFFTQLAKLPQAEIQRLAGLKADPTKGGPNSVTSDSIDKLVSDYGLDPRLGEAMKAGQVKLTPLKNELGQEYGPIAVVDLTAPNGGSVQILNPSKGSPAYSGGPGQTTTTPQLPGTTPDNGAAVGALPAADTTKPPVNVSDIPKNNPKYFGNKASMFLAAGPIATGLQAASGASEMINPKMIIPEGAQASDRQTMIDTLRSDLAAMGQLGGGIGVNKGVLEGYLKLAPTGSVGESPHQGIQKAIRLSEHVQQEIDAQTEVFHDTRQPIETRKAAQALIQGWQRVQRDLPTPAELTAMETAIRTGTAGAPTISGAADTIAKAAGKAVTEVKKEVGTVAKDQGLSANQPDIDSISDPQALVAIDPKSLSRENKIKLMRKIDSLRTKKR